MNNTFETGLSEALAHIAKKNCAMARPHIWWVSENETHWVRVYIMNHGDCPSSIWCGWCQFASNVHAQQLCCNARLKRDCAAMPDPFRNWQDAQIVHIHEHMFPPAWDSLTVQSINSIFQQKFPQLSVVLGLGQLASSNHFWLAITIVDGTEKPRTTRKITKGVTSTLLDI